MRRVVVVGIAGAGKSALAARLATRLDVPHVELDALTGPRAADRWLAACPESSGEPEADSAC